MQAKEFIAEKLSARTIETRVRDIVRDLVVKNTAQALSKPHLVYKKAAQQILQDMFPEIDTKVIAKSVASKRFTSTFRTYQNPLTDAVDLVEIELQVPRHLQNLKPKAFINQAESSLVHELIHAEQKLRGQFRQGGTKNADIKKYLANELEIEAYAGELARNIAAVSRYNPQAATPELILSKITHPSIERNFLSQYTEFRAYKVIFGQSDDPADQRVWRRFLKKFTQHLSDYAEADSAE